MVCSTVLVTIIIDSRAEAKCRNQIAFLYDFIYFSIHDVVCGTIVVFYSLLYF